MDMIIQLIFLQILISQEHHQISKMGLSQDYQRYNLFLEYSALINLKKNNPVFRTSNYRMETWGTQKQIYIDDPSMNVVIIGNLIRLMITLTLDFKILVGGMII